MIEINDNDYKSSILNFTNTIIQLSEKTNSVNENNSFTYQLTNTSNIVYNAKIIYGDLIKNNKINLKITDTAEPPVKIYNSLLTDINRLMSYTYVIKVKHIYNINNNIASIKKQINDNINNYNNCNWLYKGAFEALYPRINKTKKKIKQYLTDEINNTNLILSLFYMIIFQGILSDIRSYIDTKYTYANNIQQHSNITMYIDPIVIINFDKKYVLKITLILIYQLNININDYKPPDLKYVYLITYGYINNGNAFIKIFIYDPDNTSNDILLHNYKYIKDNAFRIFTIKNNDESTYLTTNYADLLKYFKYINDVKALNLDQTNTLYAVKKNELFYIYTNLFSNKTSDSTDYSFLYNLITFININ